MNHFMNNALEWLKKKDEPIYYNDEWNEGNRKERDSKGDSGSSKAPDDTKGSRRQK